MESRSSESESAQLSPVHHSSSPTAHLELEDGTRYEGRAFGAKHSISGEVVFATGMVGYPESLTDPSYRGQLLTLTYPLVGNYGVPARHTDDPLSPGFESSRIQAQALVVQNLCRDSSHWNAASSLDDWMIEEGIPGIEGIDVRALTRRLREHGTIKGRLLIDGSPDREEIANSPYQDPSSRNVVAEVSCKEPILHRCGLDDAPRVILVDCGAKTSIVRSLLDRGADVLQVPWNHDFVTEKGDAVLLSNGPGDPKNVIETVENIRRAFEGSRPLMGICLGNQLLALAAGFNTYKLDFGHRSQNQPCVEVGTSRCWVTSQNHGYAVDGATAPDGWQ
ncbi:MAG: glutamine-hydrolyzing carbamoyl-phosphate synthase small subunit, partial [Planctomycetota bacterium]